MKKLTKEEIESILAEPNGALKLAGINVDQDALLDSAKEMFIEGGAASALLLRLVNKKQYVIKLREDGAFSAALEARLSSDSPKLRRNCARLIGKLGLDGMTDALTAALEREDQRFVRPSIILALGELGGEKAKEALENHAVPPAADETERKHFLEETEALELAKRRFRPRTEHAFTGFSEEHTLELRAPELLTRQLADELEGLGFEPEDTRHSSLKIKTRDYASVFEARCFHEALIPLGQTALDPDAIAKKAAPQMEAIMRETHSGEAPYRFRVEVRSSLPEGKFDRGSLVKAAALAVEAASNGALDNSPSDYEAELRIEGNERTARLFMKLCTYRDERFAYRKGSIPASMNPAVAAAVLHFAQEHLSVNARVIDPCCGSGTFLIERGLLSPCASLTGVDIAHHAIDIARENTALSGVNAKYTVNDILRFECHRPYDELISNLPFGNRVGDHSSCEKLYKGLLDKLPQLVKKGGTAILYTMEFTLLKRLIRERSAFLELVSQARTEAGGLTPMIFILKVK
ncbi:MAG: methyltransferase domain-containing protein [Clostridia bacterium]|nr:methyltransferase domain-containing protein [Clostridia bacterium]